MERKRGEEKEYGKATIALHQKIKEAIDDAVKKDSVPCVLVSSVEKEVGADPRTVKLHLKLLEQAGYGKLSKDGKMFCPEKK